MGGIGKAYEKAGRIEGRKEGRIEAFFQLVDKGIITIDEAAKSENMTVEELLIEKEKYEKESL